MAQLLFLILFTLLLVNPCSALQITFKQEALVDRAVITLGDIVQFDEKSEMTRALGTQKVAQSPPPGESVVLRSLSIKKNLISSLSLSNMIEWKGSPSVTLKRTCIFIGSTKIQAIIAEYLSQNKADMPDAEIRFIPAVLPLPFNLPTGELSYEVIPSNPRILGSSKFSIIFRVDNRVAKNMSIKGRVEALAQVVVATSKLQKGTVLTSANMTLAVKDLSEIAEPGLDIKNFLGKKIKRSLRPGAPIHTSMVEICPIIQRGERVKMVINHGSMHLSTVGIARNNGRQDQMIRVQNINSNKIVYCRVAAPGLVEVVL